MQRFFWISRGGLKQNNIFVRPWNETHPMDVHRVNAYVLESGGQYNLAIPEYDKAIQIKPNFTFLYLPGGELSPPRF